MIQRRRSGYNQLGLARLHLSPSAAGGVAKRGKGPASVLSLARVSNLNTDPSLGKAEVMDADVDKCDES